MQIRQIEIYKLSIPMRPFTIATGTMHFAQNIFIRVHTDAGLTGMGECSAFPMIVGETQETAFVLARDFAKLWLGKDASDITARLAELDLYIAGNRTIKSAFDMALYDLAAKHAGLPLYAFLGGTHRALETDLTIGIGSAEEMAMQARDFVARGVRIIKIKLGKDPQEDIRRVQAIRREAPDSRLRIDANQGWDFESAVQALQGLAPLDIEFCEQPMRRHNDYRLPELRRLSPIPIMADESVFDHYEAERLIEAGACDMINIKLAKSGGIAEALRIHSVCTEKGIPCMMGGMLESRLALSANFHLALACATIRYYDMDTCLLGHLEDPVLGGVQYRGYFLEAPDSPGLGADISPEFLQRCEKALIQ